MIAICRASERYVTEQPGITTRHCFSSGGHYDPANVSFGPLIAVDEHLLAPGAGFDRHAHRGVELLSWVLDGTLRHEDSAGRTELIRPGVVQYQHAGAGIEHVERNASDDEPLRFVQLWFLADGATPRYAIGAPPTDTEHGRFGVLRGAAHFGAARRHLYVTRGEFTVGAETIRPGDSIRADEPITVDGAGELLAWTAR